MNAAAASDLLLNKKGSDLSYITRMQTYQQNMQKQANAAAAHPSSAAGKSSAADAGMSSAADPAASVARMSSAASTAEISSAAAEMRSHPLYRAVLQGEKNSIVNIAKEQLAQGLQPETLINEYLIPAINEVGELFDQQKYFLPQLIGSANAMKTAIGYLEPMIERTGNGKESIKLVIATVEGDIHDIGKNLVVLMLRNYGYHVIDLGKDIPAETIVSTAIREHAAVIGLSALMTTTMMRMQDVVQLAKEKHYSGKIIIGGAAITQSFADEIGADGYSKDAAACVRLVEKLVGK